MFRNSDQWIRTFKDAQALWVRGEQNKTHPHLQLNAFQHTSSYFDSATIVQRPRYLEEAVSDLLEILIQKKSVDHDYLIDVDRVMGGLPLSAILASEVARQINRHPGASCKSGFAMRRFHPVPGQDQYSMSLKGNSVIGDENVLFVSTEIMKGYDLRLMHGAVRDETRGRGVGYVLTLMNWSGLQRVHGMEIISLISIPGKVWENERCPLCPTSQALRWEDPNTWEELTERSF